MLTIYIDALSFSIWKHFAVINWIIVEIYQSGGTDWDFNDRVTKRDVTINWQLTSDFELLGNELKPGYTLRSSFLVINILLPLYDARVLLDVRLQIRLHQSHPWVCRPSKDRDEKHVDIICQCFHKSLKKLNKFGLLGGYAMDCKWIYSSCSSVQEI